LNYYKKKSNLKTHKIVEELKELPFGKEEHEKVVAQEKLKAK
jgi:hypothetical protein